MSINKRGLLAGVAIIASLALQGCSQTTDSNSADQGAAPVASSTRQIGTEDLRNAADNNSEWLSYGRTWSEQRYSPLDQINRENVADLQLELHDVAALRSADDASADVVLALIHRADVARVVVVVEDLVAVSHPTLLRVAPSKTPLRSERPEGSVSEQRRVQCSPASHLIELMSIPSFAIS